MPISALSIHNADGSRTPVSAKPRHGAVQISALSHGQMVVADTPWGELELSLDPSTLYGRKGRGVFSPDLIDDPTRSLKYLWLAVSAHGPDLVEWPTNSYSRTLLSSAATTYDPATSRNVLGFDRLGFNESGVNRRGFRTDGSHTATGTLWDPAGYDISNRSETGLPRPLAWYDEILDRSPAKEAYLQARRPLMKDPDTQWEFASRLMLTASNWLNISHHASHAETASALATLADDLLEYVLPPLKTELEALMPHHLHVPNLSHAAACESASKLSEHIDPDDAEFDHGLVLTTLKRRLSGRFALAGLTPLLETPNSTIIDDAVLSHLADDLVRDLRASALLEMKLERTRAV